MITARQNTIQNMHSKTCMKQKKRPFTHGIEGGRGMLKKTSDVLLCEANCRDLSRHLFAPRPLKGIYEKGDKTNLYAIPFHSYIIFFIRHRFYTHISSLNVGDRQFRNDGWGVSLAGLLIYFAFLKSFVPSTMNLPCGPIQDGKLKSE